LLSSRSSRSFQQSATAEHVLLLTSPNMASPHEAQGKEAFVTLATNDSYALGALVLAHSLKRTQTTRSLCVMITSLVTSNMKQTLQSVYDDVVEVDLIDSGDSTRLALMNRPDLGMTFTKIRCWLLTQYEKCVFLDADTLIVQNIDELFDREELSAAPDAGWPDCFNSGVFVFRPSKETYEKLVAFALTHGSFDGGDQGLLNLFFKNWATLEPSRRLPFTYNVVSQAFYSYLPAYMWFNKDIKVAHFIGSIKPWHHVFDKSTGRVQLQAVPGHDAGFLQTWWDIFIKEVEPKLGGISSSTAGAKLVSGNTYTAQHSEERQYRWEEGQVDYMGSDSFKNIEAQLKHTIKNGSPKK